MSQLWYITRSKCPDNRPRSHIGDAPLKSGLINVICGLTALTACRVPSNSASNWSITHRRCAMRLNGSASASESGMEYFPNPYFSLITSSASCTRSYRSFIGGILIAADSYSSSPASNAHN